MLYPSDQEWKHRLPPTAGSEPRPSEPTDNSLRSVGDEISTPGQRSGGQRHRCPVCEFGSDDHDDVYVHLMTAHRKSTISAALLRRR